MHCLQSRVRFAAKHNPNGRAQSPEIPEQIFATENAR